MMISKNNQMINVKISKNTYDFLKQFCSDYSVSLSNFCEYSIDSVVSDIGYRTQYLSDSSVHNFLLTFSKNINNLYRKGDRK